MTTIDLTEPESTSLPWRAPVGWLVAVVVYAFVLHWQIGLPLEVTFRQSAFYVLSLAVLVMPAQWWARRSLAAHRTSAALFTQHMVVAVLTIGAWFGVNLLWDRWNVGPNFWLIIYASNWLFQLLFAVTAYGTVIGLTLAGEGWRRERERERREAALLIQARDAELGAIRAQFQPHFVLNALNSLLALIDRDPALARTMVVRLADVMKEVFDREDTPIVPLDREVGLTRAYLDIEQIRFGSRLTVTIDVDPRARDVPVPAFLLQPIVENAVKHGIAPFAGPGTIDINARVAGESLVVTVKDSGTGGVSPANGLSVGGRGLTLTRRRLETIYGQRQTLSLEPAAGGVVATITVPLEADGG